MRFITVCKCSTWRDELPYDEEFITALLLDVGKAIDRADHVTAGLEALEGVIAKFNMITLHSATKWRPQLNPTAMLRIQPRSGDSMTA